MGFKDGTDDIQAEEADAMNDFVWVQPGDQPAWMVGGTYLIARRIKILFDVWDATTLEDQQRVIGREKLTGAPLGSQSEYDPANLSATGSNGEPLIPADAHIRLANPQNNSGQRILRRGYAHAEELGGARLGGERGRLRFDLAQIRRDLACHAGTRSRPAAARRARRQPPTRRRGGVELIPYSEVRCTGQASSGRATRKRPRPDTGR